jgi:peptide-methionine (S)-S-oxide reductase
MVSKNIKWFIVTFVCVINLPCYAEESKNHVLEAATFAGGCFWCMEHPFDILDGVVSTTSGYTGGHTKDPTYKQTSRGNTGHAEVVQIIFNPSKVTYNKLLDVFWKNIDPTVMNRQFCDIGSQYRTAIFYHNSQQRQSAEVSKQALLDANKVETIVTEIVAASVFYPAEDYHQNYYITNPLRYKFYRYNCGRDKRLREIWGDAPKHN